MRSPRPIVCFPSWPALKHAIEAGQTDRRTRPFIRKLGYYDDRAQGLVSARDAGVPQALAQIREWHPAFAQATDDEIRQAPFDRDAARLVYARQHGRATWDEFCAWIDALARGTAIEPFMQVFDAMKQQDWGRVQALVTEHPALVRERGTNGNTLLNLGLSIAGGLSTSVVPPQALTLLTRFLDAGADVNEVNDRGWSPLHQVAYANQVFLAERLMERGAAPDLEAHGAGGTPLAVALFWGHRDVADVLAAIALPDTPSAIVPRNLRIAAGLGRADLIDECFLPDGRLTAAARAGRGFYRPHSGFPLWQPSDDRQEILDEALVWACKADRVDVLGTLIARGARIDADPYRGTPLTWAAANGRLDTVSWLLDHGADVNRRGTFGGPTHGQGITALHLAAQWDRFEVVRLLVERGADVTIPDDLYHSTPEGWAGHFNHVLTRDFLRDAAG